MRNRETTNSGKFLALIVTVTSLHTNAFAREIGGTEEIPISPIVLEPITVTAQKRP